MRLKQTQLPTNQGGEIIIDKRQDGVGYRLQSLLALRASSGCVPAVVIT